MKKIPVMEGMPSMEELFSLFEDVQDKEEELPEEESYDGYLQLENGVGMLRLLLNEFEDAMRQKSVSGNMQANIEQGNAVPENDGQCNDGEKNCGNADGTTTLPTETTELSLATGKLAYPYIKRMAERMMTVWPQLNLHVYEITNYFFGENITVSGLITGQDLVAQLKGKPLGKALLLPENILRSGETVFLDDMTVEGLEKTLQVPVNIVKSSGYDFVESILSICT